MKLLITTPIFPPEIGGPATYIYELCRRWSEKHEISVITFGENPKPIAGIKVTPVRLKYRLFGSLQRQSRLLYAILKQLPKADVLYAQGPFVVGLMSALAAWMMRKRLVIKFVGDLTWENAFGSGKTTQFLDEFLAHPDSGGWTRLKIKIQKAVFHSADQVVVPSRYLKKVLMTHYHLPENKITVIYNAIEVPIGNEKSKSSSGVKKLLTIGRLVKWKHVDQIIEAVHRLPFSFRLDIVGEGPEKKHLEKKVKALHLEQQIIFHGSLAHEKTLKMLLAADVFILNSSYEGLPHTVIEAMLCETPVIATRIPGTTEIAREGETALLVEKNNVKELMDAIVWVATHPAEIKEQVERAATWTQKRFNWDENLRNLEKVLSHEN